MATVPEIMQLALAHQQNGRLREAETAYREILARDPRHVESLNNLGNLLRNTGRGAEAIGCFERALTLCPTAAVLYFNLANVLRTEGQIDRALSAYRRSVELDPNLAVAYNNLARLQMDLEDWEGARRSLEAAVLAAPDYADAHYNLGWLRHDRGDLAAAEKSYRRAIELDPDRAEAHYNLGLVHQSQRNVAQAREHFNEALRIRPEYAQPHCNLGILCLVEGKDDEALAHFDRALEIDPECPEAHCNRGQVLLIRGDFAAGWPEYAWHRRCPSFGDPVFDKPVWDGSPLAGRTLLIHGSFGLGDTLQFARYVPEAHKRGAGRVVLAAQETLHPLLAASGFSDLVSSACRDLQFDFYISVIDLPGVFASTDETIPAEPYLRAAAPAVSQWATALGGIEGFRVGIIWQGNRDYMWDHLRSIPLAEFEPLARVRGVRLISLQKGDGLEQLPQAAEQFEVIELPDVAERSFMDTAAIIANLDLVVSSDTAIVHLAGAMGKHVWLALPLKPDWRWQLGRDTTPWYPNTRLFRQETAGDWSGVFRAMAAQLPTLVNRVRPTL